MRQMPIKAFAAKVEKTKKERPSKNFRKQICLFRLNYHMGFYYISGQMFYSLLPNPNFLLNLVYLQSGEEIVGRSGFIDNSEYCNLFLERTMLYYTITLL